MVLLITLINKQPYRTNVLTNQIGLYKLHVITG